MQWKIYYSDGSTFSDADGSPFHAPGRGVLLIVLRDESVGRRILARRDHYWWADNTWTCGDLFGMFDYQIEPGPQKVIHGRTVVVQDYEQALKSALADPCFPPKSAKVGGEVF